MDWGYKAVRHTSSSFLLWLEQAGGGPGAEGNWQLLVKWWLCAGSGPSWGQLTTLKGSRRQVSTGATRSRLGGRGREQVVARASWRRGEGTIELADSYGRLFTGFRKISS